MRWLVTSYLKFVTTLHHGFDHCLLTFFQSSYVSRRIYLQQSGNLWKHGKEVWKPLSEAEIKHPSFTSFHDSKTRARISTLLKPTTNQTHPQLQTGPKTYHWFSVTLPGRKKIQIQNISPTKTLHFTSFTEKSFAD